MSVEKKICEQVGSGWIFPLSTFEIELSDELRAAIYAVMLIYFFFGVAIISDIFMSSIDMITSRRKQMVMWKAREPYVYTPKVWNDTVATLSLMALGSSAPEIFLSMVEIFKKQFHIGPLGTSTIVGSAAFNLLVIIAVCMVVIPKGEGRIIKDLPAFYITAAFSLFAYAWLAFIIEFSSPNVVELWEAVLTLLFLPLLIFISWWADVGGYSRFGQLLGLLPPEELEEEPEVPENLLKFKNQQGCMKGRYFVTQSLSETKHLDIFIEYTGKSPASVNYRSETFTAVPAYHYEDIEGTVSFNAGDHTKCIQLPIRPVHSEIDRDVAIILCDPEGGDFDPSGNGGEDECILLITIQPYQEETEEQVGRSSLNSMLAHTDNFKKKGRTFTEKYIGSTSGLLHVLDQWKEQFIEALYCGGSPDEQKDSSWPDFITHIIVMPWQVLFCCAPPLYMGGGWARFTWSLFGIGCMTMVVSDLAELFGCVLDISGICTALIFVALGTSMPDLFASLSAAKEDPTADAAIVNVTGSNSVNVFLGVGLPYTIAAGYWEATGKDFEIHTEGLSFSILSFCIICVAALVLLWGRRRFVGSELGGPQAAKFVGGTTFLCFWMAFVAIANWRVSESNISAAEALGALMILIVGVAVLVVLNFLVLFTSRALPEAVDEDAASKADEEHTSEKSDASPKQPGMRRSQSGISNKSEHSSCSQRSTTSSGRKRAPVLSFGKKNKDKRQTSPIRADGTQEPKSPKSPTLLSRSSSGLAKNEKEAAENAEEQV